MSASATKSNVSNLATDDASLATKAKAVSSAGFAKAKAAMEAPITQQFLMATAIGAGVTIGVLGVNALYTALSN